MKKETCPFCGHRWTRSSQESNVVCPSCGSKYNIKELEERIREEFEEENFNEEDQDKPDL